MEQLKTGQHLITAEIIHNAVRLILDNCPSGTQIILFGSQARRTSTSDSDIDFLVIEPRLKSRHDEMVRLRQIVRPLRVPFDVVVVSREYFENWKLVPNTLVNEAYSEGVNYGVAA